MQHHVITGANRGIGLELVRQLLGRGDRVEAACRDPDLAPELAKLVEGSKGAARVHRVDVASDAHVANMAAAIKEPIDVVINCAGVYGGARQTAADFDFNEAIRTYTDAGWLAFAPVDANGTEVLATQTIGGTQYNAVLETNTGGRNVHFSTESILADDNLLWQAIDYADGLVRAGVQGAIAHPETAALIRKLMIDRGLEVPPVNRNILSVCVVSLCQGW